MKKVKEKALKFYYEKAGLPFGLIKVLEESGKKSELSQTIDIVIDYYEDILDGMICSDCGGYNCSCDWFVLNRRNIYLINKIEELKKVLDEI